MLYRFADKICSETFCNDILDSIRAKLKSDNTYVDCLILLDMYEIGLGSSLLASLGLQTVVWASLGWPKKWKNGLSYSHMEQWVKQPELLLDFTKEALNYDQKSYDNPATRKGYQFHQHDQGSPCSAASGT